MIQLTVSGETLDAVRQKMVALLVSLGTDKLVAPITQEHEVKSETPAATTPIEPPAPQPEQQSESAKTETSAAGDSEAVVDFEKQRAALRSKLSGLIAAGKQAPVNELVKKYAPALSQVKNEDLAKIAEEAEAL